MAYEPLKPEELKKLVLMGKKRTLNMAYNPGPKEADLMIIDRIKAPDVLGRIAKKEGAGNRILVGTFDVEKRKMIVTATQTVQGAAKKLRKFLKTLDFSYKVEILDAEGNLLEEDDEEEVVLQTSSGSTPQPIIHEEPELGAQPDTAEEDAEAAKRAALKARLQALQPPLAALGTAGAPLKKGVAMVVDLLKAGRLDKAEEYLAQIEDAVAKAAGATERRSAPKVPDKKELVARAASLKSVLESQEETDTSPIKALLVQALTKLNSSDLSGADADLTAAEKALNDLSDSSPKKDGGETKKEEAVSAEQQQWEAALPALQAEIDAAMQAKTGDLSGINRSFGFACDKADAGDYVTALKAADVTRKLLADARQATQNARVQEAEDTALDNLVPFITSRSRWIETRNALEAELTKIKIAIEAKVQRDSALSEIAQNTDVLFDYIEDLDSSLEVTLHGIIETPNGPERDKLKTEARQIITNYRSTLDSEFFTLVDNNGFTKTDIRTTALTALEGVETALAA